MRREWSDILHFPLFEKKNQLILSVASFHFTHPPNSQSVPLLPKPSQSFLTHTTQTVRNKFVKCEHIGKANFDIPFMIQSHAESMKEILGALWIYQLSNQHSQFSHNLWNWAELPVLVSVTYVLQFFSLISVGLGGLLQLLISQILSRL